MNEEIGNAAGQLWSALQGKELSLTEVKKATGLKSPLLDWAIGWLAREDKLEIVRDKRTFRFRLK